MSTKTGLRACIACTKAKRSCNKGMPRCGRCQSKGKQCKYPPARPTAWDYAVSNSSTSGRSPGPMDGGGVASDDPPSAGPSSPTIPAFSLGSGAANVFNQPITDLVIKSAFSQQADWFYTPDSWDLNSEGLRPRYPLEYFDVEALRQFIDTTQDWIRGWITTGRAPFIHHKLYHEKFPECMQDAFMAATAYYNRTKDSKQMCFRIIQDRARKLVDQLEPAVDVETGLPLMDAMSFLDPLDHLARVQALIIYQIIGFFDGDIALRGMAERNTPTLVRWAKEMWECAELESAIFSAVHTMPEPDDVMTLRFPSENPDLVSWRHWIVFESIRRTWLLLATTMSIYNGFKQGWTECIGGPKYTARAGVWDAKDGYSWSRAIRRGSGPLMVNSMHMNMLLTSAKPEEVDEFAQTILTTMMGLETVARWLNHGK